jgi:tetratricopeptide (TPR) repeat protein
MFKPSFGWLTGMFSGMGDKGRRKAKRVSQNTFAPSGAGAALPPKVLLVNLIEDPRGKVANHVIDSLNNFDGWDVYRIKQELEVPVEGTLAERLLAAAADGHMLMKEESADILLWGEVDGETLRLRFLPAIPSSDSQPGAFGLGDWLALPAQFGPELEEVLHVSVLATVGPTFRGARARLGERLGEKLQMVKVFLEAMPEGLTVEQQASILTCIGNGFGAHSRLGGGGKRLGHAITTYKLARARVSAETAPVAWAITQSHLGAALRSKGIKTKETAPLKAAAVIYRQIADTLGRGEHPNDWALAQLNLGQVLFKLAHMENQTAYYEESGKAHEEALSVYTKEKMPARWAEVTDNHGVVLMTLGEMANANATLEQAVTKLRKALGVRNRERFPEQWAQTANNLGAACFALGKRKSGATLLREAISCFEGAQEIFTESGATKRAAVIGKNLTRVERVLLQQSR